MEVPLVFALIQVLANRKHVDEDTVACSLQSVGGAFQQTQERSR
jgi:hypothetical protein